MEIVIKTRQFHGNAAAPIRRRLSNIDRKPKTSISWSKTLIRKPIVYHQPSLPRCSSSNPSTVSAEEQILAKQHTTFLVERYHEHQRLKNLLQKLERTGSCSLQLLEEDEDWNKDHFWAVVRFLNRSSRYDEILPVFNSWKSKEKSRINELNYEKIICLLSAGGMMDEAIAALHEMKDYGLKPSLEIYNSIIHSYAAKGNFETANMYMDQMKDHNLSPLSGTYSSLIEAYGRCKMYDEIGMCLKRMEENGCSPDHMTFNLLIREFARGGLLKRMERTYQSMMSRKMVLQPLTLMAMLEAYAEFRILEKMAKIYRKVLSSNLCLNEELVRKLADVYVDNRMYSRLDDLGRDLASTTRRSDLVWCLRLLSYACIVSRNGLNLVFEEMEESRVSWNITFANIALLCYLKMKDLKSIKILLSELGSHNVEPDMVTVGVLFDSSRIGLDGTSVFETWRKMGFLERLVETDTDPLVLKAFGKGWFLKTCEDVYCALDPEARELKSWTYQTLISLVVEHDRKQNL